MKKIGFADYYIGEWHADNYPAWIREACEKYGYEYRVSYVWAERDTSPVNGITTGQWCEKNGVTRCDTLRELCEKSDVILVLAPSEPEKHLPYAREIFPFGKPTYVDKTFAPDTAEAEEIFRLAERYHTPFFSTSALRYATELDDLPDPAALLITGGGSNLPEYLVHQAEIAVKLLKEPVTHVRVLPQEAQCLCGLRTVGGKEATLIYAKPLPFTVCADAADGTSVYRPLESAYFPALLADILRFYETGTVSFDVRETLEVMRIRTAILGAYGVSTDWINIR